jgi:flagellar biosynthesis anti-sigma factor FlgM
MKVSNDKGNGIVTALVRKTGFEPPKVGDNRLRRQEALKDKIQISTKNEVISNLIVKAKHAPQIRTEKVESIKEALKKGEYKIDSHEVAKKIVREGILNEIV